MNKAEQRLIIEALPPIVDKFCPDCGLQMIIVGVEESYWFGKFDKDGFRQVLVVSKCPNKRWYHINRHEYQMTLVILSERGD